MILFFCFAITYATLYADRYGNREIVLGNVSASLTLPNSTVISSVNILNTLQQMQQSIIQLQQDLVSQRNQLQQDLAQIRGCAWEGIACHCKYTTLGYDMGILIGSNCTNGTLYWVKILNAFAATSSIGCAVFNYTNCSIVM